MKLKSSIALSENGFVFNAESGESFTLNAHGLAIMQRLREEMNESSLLNLIMEDFEVDREMAERDMHDFLHSLEQYHLLEK